MSKEFAFDVGTLMSYHGHECVYRGLAVNGRCQISDGENWILEIPDENGFPVWPTVMDVLNLMADGHLFLRADPLADPIRRRARRAEPTRSEVANVKCKSKGKTDQSRDPWYYLREMTLSNWDDPEIERCPLTQAGIDGWYAENFDRDELIGSFGRLPSDTTFRKWIHTRGTENDRRPADCASYKSIGIRRRKIDPVVLQIVKLWVIRFHAKDRKSVNSVWNKAKKDVERYIRGDKLDILEFERALEIPKNPDKVKMCTRRIFGMEIEKARGGKALSIAFNMQARKQRHGGGGVAQEPVRFLQYVQLDDTPFPMVFVIDAIRGVPVGIPTVTIAIDIFTRVIIGWDITFEPPSYASYMRTILHTALPKRMPEELECDPELARALMETCGVIVGHIVVDNASALTGRSAQDASSDVGHGIRWAGVHEPTHKPHVESCIGKLSDLIRDELPAGTWDIPLMREFGYDPSKQAIVTIDRFRDAFAIVVARYNTSKHGGILDRFPIELWIEQRAQHGLDMVRDVDHLRRAIGQVVEADFRGEGAMIEGLRYGSDGSDDRYPVTNEDLLYNLGMARGVASDTKKRTFPKVKFKYDPNDMSVAWMFDEHLGEYVDIPCAMRRYSENLPLWLHRRLKDYASEKRLKFETEHDMIDVHTAYSQAMRRVIPDAFVAERRAAGRLADSSQGRAYLGDAIKLLKVEGSLTGMENVIRHDTRVGTRGDPNRTTPRSSNRNGRKGRRDRRDAPGVTTSSSADMARQDTAMTARRLDIDTGSEGYA
jgi:putative transposase